MDKLHTFVICAYKNSEFLEECIKSVVRQRKYSDVILATSTPGGYITDLCRKYDIPVYVNHGETGITQDWEFAAGQASTPLVTIAHQDDVYFDDYSRRIIEEYKKAKHPLIIFTDYYELRDGTYVKENRLLKVKRIMLLPLKIRPLQKSRWIRRRILSLGSPICCPSTAYVMPNLCRPLFLNHFRTNEDWEAWERFSNLKGEFVYCSTPLMAHRIHEGSETSAMIRDSGSGRSKEDYEMYRKFWPDFMAKILVKAYKKSEDSNKM